MASLQLRELSLREREVAFASGRSYGTPDMAPYVDAVREMEGGVAYAFSTNGTTARSLKVRLNKAAKTLDLHLRWAKCSKDAKEVVVELGE